jgi:hypothetical protein
MSLKGFKAVERAIVPAWKGSDLRAMLPRNTHYRYRAGCSSTESTLL